MKNNLLVVDDDPMAVKLVKDIASASGYNVFTAANGREGIEVAARMMPDLILMDIMMPEMDGYKAVAGLRSNPKTARIPVIMLTAVGFELNKKLALTMGATDYITKPLNIRELMEKVGKFLTPATANPAR